MSESMSVPELAGFLRLARESLPDGDLVSLQVNRAGLGLQVFPLDTGGLALTDIGVMADAIRARIDDYPGPRRAAVEAIAAEHGVRLNDMGWLWRDLHDDDNLATVITEVMRAIDALIAAADASTQEVGHDG